MTSIRPSSSSIAQARPAGEGPSRKRLRFADSVAEPGALGAQAYGDATFVRHHVREGADDAVRETVTDASFLLHQSVGSAPNASLNVRERQRLPPLARDVDVAQRPTLTGHLQLADSLYDQNRVAQAWLHYESAWTFIVNAAAREVHDAHYRAATEQHPRCPWRLSMRLLNVRDLCITQARVAQVAELAPKSALALCVQAMHTLQEHDAAAAQTLAQEALRLQPNCVEALWLLGRATAALGLSLACLNRARRLRPSYAEAHSQYGDKLLSQNNLSGALAAFDRSLEFHQNDILAHSGRGTVLLAQNDLQGALTAFNRSLQLNSNDAVAHSGRGFVLHRQNDLAGALRAYGRSLRLNPNNALVHSKCGDALLSRNCLSDALKAYEQSLRLNPNDALAHGRRGDVLIRQNDLSGALAAFDRSIDLNPNDAKVHSLRAFVLLRQGNPLSALAAFDRSIALNPHSAIAHSLRGFVLLRQGNPLSALAAINLSLQLNPNDAVVHSQRGDVLRRQNDLLGALAAFDRSIELNPYDAVVHSRRGAVLMRQNDLSGALAAFDRSIELRHGVLGKRWRAR